MNTYIEDVINAMKAANLKSKVVESTDFILDNRSEYYEVDETLEDTNGKLRVLYSRDKNLMLLELTKGGSKTTHFYFVQDSDMNPKKKFGMVGLYLMAYADKYARIIDFNSVNYFEWEKKISEEIVRVKKGEDW